MENEYGVLFIDEVGKNSDCAGVLPDVYLPDLCIVPVDVGVL